MPMKGMTMVQRYATNDAEPDRQAEAVIAFDGYLETLGVSLVAIRALTTTDETQTVVIVDERLARETWLNETAIGQRLALISNISARAGSK